MAHVLEGRNVKANGPWIPMEINPNPKVIEGLLNSRRSSARDDIWEFRSMEWGPAGPTRILGVDLASEPSRTAAVVVGSSGRCRPATTEEIRAASIPRVSVTVLADEQGGDCSLWRGTIMLSSGIGDIEHCYRMGDDEHIYGIPTERDFGHYNGLQIQVQPSYFDSYTFPAWCPASPEMHAAHTTKEPEWYALAGLERKSMQVPEPVQVDLTEQVKAKMEEPMKLWVLGDREDGRVDVECSKCSHVFPVSKPKPTPSVSSLFEEDARHIRSLPSTPEYVCPQCDEIAHAIWIHCQGPIKTYTYLFKEYQKRGVGSVWLCCEACGHHFGMHPVADNTYTCPKCKQFGPVRGCGICRYHTAADDGCSHDHSSKDRCGYARKHWAPQVVSAEEIAESKEICDQVERDMQERVADAAPGEAIPMPPDFKVETKEVPKKFQRGERVLDVLSGPDGCYWPAKVVLTRKNKDPRFLQYSHEYLIKYSNGHTVFVNGQEQNEQWVAELVLQPHRLTCSCEAVPIPDGIQVEKKEVPKKKYRLITVMLKDATDLLCSVLSHSHAKSDALGTYAALHPEWIKKTKAILREYQTYEWDQDKDTESADDKEIDQLRVQLAGCSLAANGNTGGGNEAKKGDFGWSVAYEDVMALRGAHDDLLKLSEQYKEAHDALMGLSHRMGSPAIKIRVDRLGHSLANYIYYRYIEPKREVVEAVEEKGQEKSAVSESKTRFEPLSHVIQGGRYLHHLRCLKCEHKFETFYDSDLLECPHCERTGRDLLVHKSTIELERQKEQG